MQERTNSVRVHLDVDPLDAGGFDLPAVHRLPGLVAVDNPRARLFSMTINVSVWSETRIDEYIHITKPYFNIETGSIIPSHAVSSEDSLRKFEPLGRKWLIRQDLVLCVLH
jgi:hypothetical protein